MYEERLWGWYRVLDNTKEDDQEVLTKRIHVNKNCNLSYHYHTLRTEIWTMTSGRGELVINGEYRQIYAGDVLKIPVHTKHVVKAITDLEFIEVIEVQSGAELIEEDIHRVIMEWEEIVEYCVYSGVVES